jgi:hypothetical protein
MRQQLVNTRSQSKSDLSSLAQPHVDSHQEYQLQEDSFPRFPESISILCGKVLAGYLAVSMRLTVTVGPDFHGFLWDHVLVMWIWLESPVALELPSFFSHGYQISVLFVNSLWTHQRRYSPLLAQYPKLPQASATATVFI